MRVGHVTCCLILVLGCGARTELEVSEGCPPGPLDEDGDCFAVPEDCDDADPAVHPGAADPPEQTEWRFETLAVEGGGGLAAMAVDARGCVNISTGPYRSGGRFMRGSIEGFAVEPVRASNAILSSLATDSRGRVHAVLSTEGETWLSSRDESGRWSDELLSTGVVIGESVVAVDRRDVVHVVVSRPDPSSYVALTYWRRTAGASFEHFATPVQAYDVELVVDRAGLPHVAWSTHWEMPRLMRASRDHGGGWHTDELDEEPGPFGMLGAAIDRDDVVHVVHRHTRLGLRGETAEGELRYRSSAGAREVISSGSQPWCIDAAVAPDGVLHVLFVRSGLEPGASRGDVVLAVRERGGWRLETLAMGEALVVADDSCALRFDDSGVAHVAWTTVAERVRYGRGPSGTSVTRDENCDGVDGIAEPCAP